MNVAELAERIGVRHGVEHEQARELVGDIVRALALASYAGDDMTVPGIGRIVVSHETADTPTADDDVATTLAHLETASHELSAIAARMVDSARQRSAEIDRDLARIRQTMAGRL